MWRNYLITSFRHLLKSKTFSFINISGLTLGFLCFILLALYIRDEMNFDLFHRDAARMYRVVQEEQLEDGNTRKVATVAALIGKEASNQLSEIESSCSITAFGRVTMGNDPVARGYERIMSADSNFFTFFDFPLLEGDPKTALTIPDAIVISQSLAKKYFGDSSALGKTVWSGFNRDRKPIYFTVTGVMKNMPPNSHLNIDILFSEATWPTLFRRYNEFITTDWISNTYVTYFKLKPGAGNETVATGITKMVKDHYPQDKKFSSVFTLQPLKDIHLYSADLQGNELNVNIVKPFYLYMLGTTGVLLLLIACLNYMNLSTASAFRRTREMGTRKTLGAQKGQLVRQFLVDSLLVSAVSLLLARAAAELLLPFVNNFTAKELSISSLPLEWTLALAGIILVAGILSALYPAYIAAKVSPAEALKKEIKIASRNVPVRKVLLVVQFSISILMIACTLVIYRQLQFMREKDLGFSHENLLVIDINSDRLRRNFESVKAEFAKPAEVMSITTSTRVPGEWKSFPVVTARTTAETKGTDMIFVGIDRDFLKTYGIKLLEGRTIEDPKADSLKVVLTRLAVEQLGLKNPVGQFIDFPTLRVGGEIEQLEKPFRVEVIGVVDNFHFESLRREMMPVVFAAPNTYIQRIDYYTLKIKTSNWDETVNTLKAINAKIDADNPMEFTFLDSRFEEFYRADTKRGQIFLTFSVIIVLVACMGLFALVSYSVESRIKEIGVRKVMGASVRSIVNLISNEFLVLVLIAGLVALPGAWYFTSQWLKDFAYQVAPGIWPYFWAGVATLAVAMLTISFRVIRAAVANPVDSLRSE